MSEQAEVYQSQIHPDNPNQELKPGNIHGNRAIQHGGPALTQRTGYMVDCYRLTPQQRKKEMIFQEKIIKITEDHNMMRHLALVCGPGKPRWIPATTEMKVGDVIVNDASGTFHCLSKFYFIK